MRKAAAQKSPVNQLLVNELRGLYPEFMALLFRRSEEVTGAPDSISWVRPKEIELQEIRAAVERIRSRTYGICEECDQPIPIRRLQNAPQTRNCVVCQADAERKFYRNSRTQLPQIGLNLPKKKYVSIA